MIFGVPIETTPRIRYAWVGGSIWGGMIGGIISVIYGLVITNREWKIHSKVLFSTKNIILGITLTL